MATATKSKAENSPAFYITDEGETLRDVALRSVLDDDDLRRLNPHLSNDAPLAKGTVVNCGYVGDTVPEVSLDAAAGYFSDKPKDAFSDGLLAVQQELTVAGLLSGLAVTGTPNKETTAAFRLWKQAFGYSDAVMGEAAFRSLGERRNRFVVVD